MKYAKKAISLLMALALIMAVAIPAFAADEEGSITINSAANVSVAGKTFNAYKILDVKSYTTGTGGNTATVVYTVPAEMKSFYTGRYNNLTGNEGDFDAQVVARINAETDMFAFAADALAAAKTANITPSTAKAGEGATSVKISNLALGYYIVADTSTGTATPISALILDTTNPNVDVTIKADKPSIDKKIEGNKDTDSSTTGDVEHNNAAIGDNVPYKVTSKVPDMTGYTKYYFVLNDTLSAGLTFNNDVAITVGDKTLVSNTDYTVTKTNNADKTTSVEIVFKNFIQYKDKKDDAITITYSATVNQDAEIGTAGNDNKVKLTYSNNPNVDDKNQTDKPGEKSPVGETPDAETRTYVTGIELIKVDGEGNRLTGAEFKIEGTKLNTVLVWKDVYTESAVGTYWKLKDGSYTTDDPPAEGMDQTKYESTTTKYAKTVTTNPIVKQENVTYTGTVGGDGILYFDGLSAGEYIITELKAPNGYNLLDKPFKITITWTAPSNESKDCTWSVSDTAVTDNSSIASAAMVVGGRIQITVQNQAGTELPSTGGIGTTLFYIVGGILMVGAAVLLITKRRMDNED